MKTLARQRGRRRADGRVGGLAHPLPQQRPRHRRRGHGAWDFIRAAMLIRAGTGLRSSSFGRGSLGHPRDRQPRASCHLLRRTGPGMPPLTRGAGPPRRPKNDLHDRNRGSSISRKEQGWGIRSWRGGGSCSQPRRPTTPSGWEGTSAWERGISTPRRAPAPPVIIGGKPVVTDLTS